MLYSIILHGIHIKNDVSRDERASVGLRRIASSLASNWGYVARLLPSSQYIDITRGSNLPLHRVNEYRLKRVRCPAKSRTMVPRGIRITPASHLRTNKRRSDRNKSQSCAHETIERSLLSCSSRATVILLTLSFFSKLSLFLALLLCYLRYCWSLVQYNKINCCVMKQLLHFKFNYV